MAGVASPPTADIDPGDALVRFVPNAELGTNPVLVLLDQLVSDR
jgi:hypothetical protein